MKGGNSEAKKLVVATHVTTHVTTQKKWYLRMVVTQGTHSRGVVDVEETDEDDRDGVEENGENQQTWVVWMRAYGKE